MIDKFTAENHMDPQGNPAGGFVKGTGLGIAWQEHPLGTFQGRTNPSGAFVETVIAAALQRISWYQEVADKKFACRENAIAITKLQEALFWLEHRTKDREARGVEGTLVP